MRILFLVQKEQRVILDRLYDAIAENCSSCDTRWLTGDEQANLKKYFKYNVDTSLYDRIVLMIRTKKEIRQVRFIKTIPNLVILEHDAWQNYTENKYRGKFSKYYHKIPWVRVLTSGNSVAGKLKDEGVDAVFVPKGYDQKLLYNTGANRDIELGFVGSIKSKSYSQRITMLNAISEKENLYVTRTNSGDEYLNMLNRIRFFVSADVGMGEYMIKNYEAMACGCTLLAWNQGESENHALGFVDMENVVLYSGIEEFQHKLSILRDKPKMAVSIAKAGQALVEEKYSWCSIGYQVVKAMTSPLRPYVKNNKFFGLF